MRPLFNYFAASRSELAKVTWPNRAQTVRLTTIVIVFSLVFAAALALVDKAFSSLLEYVIVK